MLAGIVAAPNIDENVRLAEEQENVTTVEVHAVPDFNLSITNHSSVRTDFNNNLPSSSSKEIPVDLTGLEEQANNTEETLCSELKRKLLANIEQSIDKQLKAFFRDLPKHLPQETQVSSCLNANIHHSFEFFSFINKKYNCR